MNADLLDMFNATLGGPLIRQLGSYLGESEDTTRAAVRVAGPALLAGVMQRTASPAGVGEIFRVVTSDTVDPGLAGKLAGMFANRGTLGSLLASGESLSGLVFGPRTAAVSNAIADTSGVRPNSALTLLSLGAPLLFGMLRKFVANNDLDASALASLLARQKSSLARGGLDDRIAGALGIGSLDTWLGSLPGRTAAGTATLQKTRDKGWLPWAIAAGIAVFGVLFFVSRTAEHQEAPGGAVQIAEVPGDSERLRVATADSAQVYFDSGDASIDAEDRQRIANVASSARDSERAVGITGYTDRTGDQDQNLELARNRAQAVRQALVSEGVSEDRIVMDPPRSVTGSGTDEEARRVDIDMR
ncbi:MAG TPA: OmpA family protein [Povalibacter sp.]|uniref:OmpA family protein n=1 Tax=Povalibacter sp. TaxID=1962978 RepID=UPI002CA49EAB|nr:OmpA family protein [Povalibacter sp.]HMN43734.1 OmpA family protein [Povalibacter sp.]